MLFPIAIRKTTNYIRTNVAVTRNIRRVCSVHHSMQFSVAHRLAGIDACVASQLPTFSNQWNPHHPLTPPTPHLLRKCTLVTHQYLRSFMSTIHFDTYMFEDEKAKSLKNPSWGKDDFDSIGFGRAVNICLISLVYMMEQSLFRFSFVFRKLRSLIFRKHPVCH